MQSIIFAERDGVELSPLNRDFCPALLPLFGKPLLQHAIEYHQSIGATEIFIIIGPQAKKIQSFFGDGARWSVSIHYLHLKHTDSYRNIFRFLGNKITFPCAASRGDIFYRPTAQPVSAKKTTTTTEKPCVIMDMPDDVINQLAWPILKAHFISKNQPHLSIINPLLSVDEYHALFLNEIATHLTERNHYGRVKNQYIRTGSQAKVKNRNLASGVVFVDDQSRIDTNSSLLGPCYIGKRCIIDRGTRIYNSIILDDTFVGKGLAIENALVFKNKIYRVDLKSLVIINDPMLLSSVSKHTKTFYFQRFLAFALFTLTLPLQLIIYAALLLTRGKNCFRILSIQTNQSNTNLESPRFVSVYEFNINSLLLRRIPSLISTIKGDIALFGRSFSHRPLKSCWKEKYLSIPVGVFSLAQCLFTNYQEFDEYELLEIENSSIPNHSLSKKLKQTINRIYLNRKERVYNNTAGLGLK